LLDRRASAGLHLTGIMQVMRWKTWVGALLVILGLGILIYSLVFRRAQASTVNFTLADGTQAQVKVIVTERGWVRDKNPFSLQLTTQANPAQTTPLVFGVRLELAGVVLSPQGTIEHSLVPGQGATFSWQVQAGNPGETPGVLWLYQLSPNADESVVYAKEFTFSDYDMLGNTPLMIRLGAGGVVTLGLLWLWLEQRKRRRKASKKTENQVS
jgi:hypothetical protein